MEFIIAAIPPLIILAILTLKEKKKEIDTILGQEARRSKRNRS